ncbi:PilZ domain-containing protein [Desulfosarcina sp.]|uniref:PilZ domain-containing protein n=1 Tax=Desulfosarcina sp. TaxID=2027861 RepID=UPI00356553CB
MADIRSKKKNVTKERRKDPRLEFHCNAMVQGIDGILTITDISLGGVFIEIGEPYKITVGKMVTINAKLPTETQAVRFKAKVVNKTNRGIGCQFIALDDWEKEAICLCFEYFKDTLPAGCK